MFVFSNNLCAQLDTAFWFVAPEVAQTHGDRPIVFRFASLENPATISITQPSNPSFPEQIINLSANDSESIDLTAWIDIIENKPADQILNFGFKISATAQITAYYEVTPTCNCNPDIFALKGQNALGTHFITPFQNLLNNASYARSGFNIIATQNNTNITITPTQNIVGHAANVPFSITLNKGQTYFAQATSTSASLHLSGSSVISDKPISMTLSDDSALGTPFGGCADLMGDQLIPLSIIGEEYIAIKGYLNGPDRIYVLSTNNGTSVSIDGVDQGVTLNNGETFVHTLSNPSCYIVTSQPSYVLHLSGFGCEVGQAILPPIICTGSNLVPFVRSTNEFFALNILVPSGAEGGFSLNGNNGIINGSEFNPVPGTGGSWLFAQLDMTSDILMGQASRIENILDKFHVGLVHGGASSGCRYGYFSDFSAMSYEINASDETICSGDTLELSTNILPGATYNWFGPDGFTAQGTNVIIPNIQNSNSGQYIIEGNFPNECELISDTILIEVIQTPGTPEIFNNAPICLGDTAEFWTNINPDFTVQWYNETGVLLGEEDSIQLYDSDPFYIQIQAFNESCSSPIVFDSIYPISPPEVIFNGDNQICGTTIDLGINIATDTNDTLLSVAWYNQNNILIGENSSVPSVNSIGTPSSNEIFTFEVETTVGCFLSDTVEVNFYATPLLEIETEDLCNASDVLFENNLSWQGVPNENTSLTYFYDLGDGVEFSSENGTYQHSYEYPDTYNATISVESSDGCVDSIDIVIVLGNIPQADILIESFCGMNANFNALLNLEDFYLDSINWITSTIGIENQIPFSYQFEEPGEYTGNLILFGQNSCVYEFPFAFNIDESISIDDLIIPNVVTSNDDGVNESIELNPLFTNCASYELKFFNRWGKHVYTQTNDTTPFDGKDFGGKNLLPGIYFYIMEFKESIKHGFITLIR